MKQDKKLTTGQVNSIHNAIQLAEWSMEQQKLDKYADYKSEAGVIVGQNDMALAMIKGTPGMVEFPEEVIWSLHKKSPGSILKLAHTHPPKMDRPSTRDIQTLETWAWALHPFPARLSVITLWDRNEFVEKTYIGTIQPKEEWIKNGKGDREVYIELESIEYFRPSLLDGVPANAWLLWIIRESYGQTIKGFN